MLRGHLHTNLNAHSLQSFQAEPTHFVSSRFYLQELRWRSVLPMRTPFFSMRALGRWQTWRGHRRKSRCSTAVDSGVAIRSEQKSPSQCYFAACWEHIAFFTVNECKKHQETSRNIKKPWISSNATAEVLFLIFYRRLRIQTRRSTSLPAAHRPRAGLSGHFF